MAVVLQHHVARMMASVTGVEDSPKKAISCLPVRRKTLSFFHRGDGLQSNFLSENVAAGRLRKGVNYSAAAEAGFGSTTLTASLRSGP
jgi:hypothetical protein